MTILLDLDAARAASWMLALNTRRRRRKGLGPNVTHAALRDVFMSFVAAETAERLMECVDPTTALLGVRALRTATRAFRDVRAQRHVLTRNDDHGLTVPSTTLVRDWNKDSIDPEVVVGMPLPIRGSAARDSTPRTFAWKIRKRTNMGFGSLRTKEPLSLDEKRTKVACAFSSASGSVFPKQASRKTVRFRGFPGRPHFGVHPHSHKRHLPTKITSTPGPRGDAGRPQKPRFCRGKGGRN